MTTDARSLKSLLVTKPIGFSTAHFYSQSLWSSDRNRTEFGACYTPHGHGHNYRLEVTLRQPIAGPFLSENDWQSLLKGGTAGFDHQHLNFDHPAFRPPDVAQPSLVPTTENILLVLRDQLTAWMKSYDSFKTVELAGLTLWEMSSLAAEWGKTPYQDMGSRWPEAHSFAVRAALRTGSFHQIQVFLPSKPNGTEAAARVVGLASKSDSLELLAAALASGILRTRTGSWFVVSN